MTNNDEREYFILLVRDNKESPWTVEFGDYDKRNVKYEQDDYCEHDYKRTNTRIVSCIGAPSHDDLMDLLRGWNV